MKIVEKQEILELISNAKKGDRTAFEQLFKEYNNIIHKVNSNWGNTQDGYQEGVLALYEAIEKYDATRNTKFSTYFYMVLRKKIRRYMEKYKNDYLEEVEHCTQNINIENTVICKDIVKSLNAKEKEFLQLHFKEGYTLTEIAELWSVSKQSISSYKFKVLAKLRKKL